MIFSTSYAIYTISQICELEMLAVHSQGLSEEQLMESAGKAAFNALILEWPLTKKIAVFCGKGNNAGDGYVLARLAHEQGLNVTVYALASFNKLKGAAKKAAQKCEEFEIPLQIFTAVMADVQADVIVDALLGIGAKGKAEGLLATAIETINSASLPVLAMDVPSGLQADTGDVL